MTSRTWQRLAAAFQVFLPALFLAPAPSSFAATTHAYSKADRVNVRSRPGFVGEIVTQLTRGQAVNVLDTVTLKQPGAGEPPVWTRIELPAEAPVWASADYVDRATGLVRADLLNIRSGPTFDHAIVARAKNGATLKVLSPPADGWIQVAAPPGSVGFVPASWLADSPPASNPPGTPSPSTPSTIASTTREAAPAVAVPNPANDPAPNTGGSPAPQKASPTISDNAWLEQFLGRSPTSSASSNSPPDAASSTNIAPPASTTPVDTSATLPSTGSETVAVASPVAVEGSSAPTPVAIQPAVVVPATETEPDPTTSVALETTSPEEGRWVRREGLVVRPSNIAAPSFYALKARDGGVLMNFLITPGAGRDALREYRGRVVIVTGREYLDDRSLWRATPLLHVETIEAVR
ncbi:MAG: SH3 domain-containing protein [Limisphaerales bacterium]